jgi:hypothetical protein
MKSRTKRAPRGGADEVLAIAQNQNPGAIELLRYYERIMKSVDLEFAIEADSYPPVEYYTSDSTSH